MDNCACGKPGVVQTHPILKPICRQCIYDHFIKTPEPKLTEADHMFNLMSRILNRVRCVNNGFVYVPEDPRLGITLDGSWDVTPDEMAVIRKLHKE